MGRSPNGTFHAIEQQENQDVIDLEDRISKLEARIVELEKKPDILFLRTMQEKLDDIDRRLKPSPESCRN